MQTRKAQEKAHGPERVTVHMRYSIHVTRWRNGASWAACFSIGGPDARSGAAEAHPHLNRHGLEKRRFIQFVLIAVQHKTAAFEHLESVGQIVGEAEILFDQHDSHGTLFA